jgi:hypothetical protein
MATNLDELKRLREKALAKGPGSKQWIDFAVASLDAFPHLYEMAQKMNDEAAHLRAQLHLAVMAERNACIGICARYRGADGDAIASDIESRASPLALLCGEKPRHGTERRGD